MAYRASGGKFSRVCLFTHFAPSHKWQNLRSLWWRVYISIALLWLRFVDDVALRPSDYIGAALCFAGAAVVVD